MVWGCIRYVLRGLWFHRAASRTPHQGTAPRGQVCLEYLERYYVLITFTAFLFDPGAGPAAPPPGSFGQWAARRPELHRYVTWV